MQPILRRFYAFLIFFWKFFSTNVFLFRKSFFVHISYIYNYFSTNAVQCQVEEVDCDSNRRKIKRIADC